jgi:protein TonB
MENNLFAKFANNWESPEAPSRLDLVFNDRLKEYGAYQIRKSYRDRVILATVIAVGLSLLFSLTPKILDSLAGSKKTGKKVVFVVENIEDIKDPEEEKEKPKEPPKQEEPKLDQQAYVTPRVNPNTKEEADPPPPADIDNPSDRTVKGIKDPTLPDLGDDDGPTGGGGGDKEPAGTVQVKAIFVGGESKFRDYVANTFQYPVRCQDEGINGRVVLRFVVDETGKISRVKAIEETKACPEFTAEAIRVLEKSPRWIPGQNNGKFIKSWREIPIQLSVEN